MKKLSNITLSVLKLSVLTFILSFFLILFGIKEGETIAGASLLGIVVFLSMFIVLKFSDSLVNIFTGISQLFKK